MKEYKSSLCESYKDFAFIFDKDLGVYVVSLEPVDVNAVDTVFINLTDENKKDSIDDVINYVDEYYNSHDYDLEDITEDIESDKEEVSSLKDLYGDIFTIELIRADNNEKEFLEFNDIELAQDYIDKLKIDNDDFFTKAILINEEQQILDMWEYVNVEEDSVENEEIVEESISEEIVEEPDLEAALPDGLELVEVPSEGNEVVIEIEQNCEPQVVSHSMDNLLEAICVCNIFISNIKMLHWYSKGRDFDAMHNLTEYYYNKASQDLDLLVELALESTSILIPNPSLMTSNDLVTLAAPENLGFAPETFWENLIHNINTYINALKNIAITSDVDESVKSEIDSIISFWRKENNYKNVRRIAE